ncbi:transporter [Brevibacillus composti]|uniref:Transporter n=1 Tax=Brevibacillus composti TaxID=2796470 RepID=A0A7T5EIF5_9BACL|nr:transporter [Brevibacillus composti]QQE73181.1 transporter [Brevibacillus composti]QUO40260.1 transporter [Brevibacillus composti]
MGYPYPPGSSAFPPGSSAFPPGSSMYPPGGFPPPPSGPPPGRTPTAPRTLGQQQYRIVDPGSFYPCLYRYTYVWLRNGRNFWFYPVFVGRNSVAGYRWNGYTWRYYGLDLHRVVYFTC